MPRKQDAAAKFLASVNQRKSLLTPLEARRQNAAKARAVNQKYENKEVAAEANRQRSLREARKVSQFNKDIGTFPVNIDWKRRLEAKSSFRAFCEIYLKDTFNKPWSDDQLYGVARVEEVCKSGGKFAFTMPRGGGKTAICRGGILWATLFGLKHFIFNVGSTEDKATGTLGAVRTQLSFNPLLHEDFPEICWPVVCLQNTNRTAKGQLFLGEQTHVSLGVEEIRYPTILFPKEYEDAYGAADPSSLRYIKHLEKYVPSNGLVTLRCSGITGSIRGEANTDPITLEQPRPDLCLLDDVQKDSTADSPLLCEKMIRLIDGAITGLAGGGKHIDVLMPCTVIREDDAADTFTNNLKKPEYQGRKFKMVDHWPEGITDHEMTYDTPAGDLWNQYAELRRVSLRDNGHWQPATDLYVANRDVMDKDFHVSWKERYDSPEVNAESRPNVLGSPKEVSGQQHAMNLRLQLGPVFLSEYQNIGRQLIEAAPILITADQLSQKTVEYKRCMLPPSTQHLVSLLDVQDEVLYYAVFACDSDFNGVFVDYGTWPEIHTPFFTKSQTYSWSMVTTLFFKEPEHAALRSKAIRNNQGKVRAPFEAKIFYALKKATTHLLGKQYIRQGEHQKEMKIQRLGIDTRWGQASEVIKRFIRETGSDNIVPYYGQALPPTNKQLEEYERREGWYFENMQHPNVREPKWVMRPAPDGTWYMMADVNRLKDFLFQRLATPQGGSGSISLYSAPKDQHELFTHHICSSEYPEPVAARGVVKNQWTVREGVAFDNDWLDCGSGCMALASLCGASVKTSEYEQPVITRRLSQIADKKRQQRRDQRTSQQLQTATLEERNIR
jgi:phage terminase large subunit GpA